MIVSDQTMTPDVIRTLQLSELYILSEFSLFCSAHTLDYTLDFGTILGAVRHQGFIPWDDDVDIAMLRVDYERFLRLAPLWTNDKLFVQYYESDPQFVHSFTRIKLNGSLALQEDWGHLSKHHGIFIDIFPYDVMPTNETERLEHEREIHEIQNLKLEKVKRMKHFHWRDYITTLLRSPRGFRSLLSLNRLQTEVMTRYNDSITDESYVSHMTQGFEHYYENRRLVSDQKNPSNLLFEGQYFPIPRNYDTFLRQVYGDYTVFPPRDQRYPHHGFIELEFRNDILPESEKQPQASPSII